MRSILARRRFLLAGTGVLGTAILAACGQAASPTAAPAAQAPAAAPTQAPAAAPAPKPTEAPKPAAAAPTTAAAAAPTTAAAAPTTAAAAAPTQAPAQAAAGAPSPTNTPRASLAVQGKGKTELLWQMSASDFWIAGTAKVLPTLTDKSDKIGKVTLQPTPDDWQNKLVAAMVAGNAPDVFDMWGDIMPPYVERGQVIDFEPLVKSDMKPEDIKDFYEWQWRDFVMPWLNNIRFGMPRYVNIMFTWYNKDLFDKAGVKYPTNDWTHDDYADAARKLTVKDASGRVTQAGLRFPADNWDRYWYKPVIWGGHTVDPNDITKAAFGEEKALAAFEWSRKLEWDDKAMLNPLDIQGQDSTLMYAAQRYAMNEEGIYPFEMDNAIQGKFRWAWAHTPKGPTGQRKVLGTTDGYAIWKGSKKQDEAWELVKWATGPINQLEVVVKAAGRVPIRKTVLNQWKDEVPKARPNLKDVNLTVAVEAMEQGYPSGREFFKNNIAAQEIIGPALQKVYLTGNTPVTYLKEIADKVTAAQKGGTR